MALRKTQSDEESQPITSMEEIRQRQGMPFDEFCAEHPWWEWTESRLARRMIDSRGRAWVPMWDPDPGVGICYDPEVTPEAEQNLVEVIRKLDGDLAAGRTRLYDLHELDDMVD